MRDAIGQGGKHGLAEVRDLALKLDEASPGLGGRFASAVTAPLSKEQLDALGIEVPQAPPMGTKIALGPAAMPLWQLGAAAFGLAATGAYAIDQTSKNLEKLPGRTPADNENKPPQAPPPALVDVPIHTGHPAETPKASDSIETFPASREERKKRFVDNIVKEVAPIIFEHRSGVFYGKDGEEMREDMRGGRRAIESNNAAAEALKEVIDESDCAELIEHDNGGSKDGKK